MFRGTYTALVTPFKNDEIDVDALESLIETQIVAHQQTEACRVPGLCRQPGIHRGGRDVS